MKALAILAIALVILLVAIGITYEVNGRTWLKLSVGPVLILVARRTFDAGRRGAQVGNTAPSRNVSDIPLGAWILVLGVCTLTMLVLIGIGEKAEGTGSILLLVGGMLVTGFLGVTALCGAIIRGFSLLAQGR